MRVLYVEHPHDYDLNYVAFRFRNEQETQRFFNVLTEGGSEFLTERILGRMAGTLAQGFYTMSPEMYSLFRESAKVNHPELQELPPLEKLPSQSHNSEEIRKD